MKIPFINYQKTPPLFNFLYAIENGFLGYEKKLNKEEKCLLKAKLIWKRKQFKNK
jgi:hypothetical protein